MVGRVVVEGREVLAGRVAVVREGGVALAGRVAVVFHPYFRRAHFVKSFRVF